MKLGYNLGYNWVIGVILIIGMFAVVSAESTATFNLNAEGDADFEFTDTLEDLGPDIDSANIMMSADGSAGVTFTGTLMGPQDYRESPYSLYVSSEGNLAKISLEMSGDDIAYFLGMYGEFNVDVRVEESDGRLRIKVNGTVSRPILEDLLLMNLSEIGGNPEQARQSLENKFSSYLSILPLPSSTRMEVDEFSISGSYTMNISISVTIAGWDELSAILMPVLYEKDQESGDFLDCIGLRTGDIPKIIASLDFTVEAELEGAEGRITAKAEATTSGGLGILENTAMESFNIQVTESSTETRISGSARFKDSKTVIGCMLKSSIPGKYEFESFDYALVKNSGQSGMQSFEGKLSGFAQKSGSNWRVSFPTELTSERTITVNVPSGMAIVSVDGGQKTGDRTAVSSPGVEFTVFYGPAGTDMTIVAVIVIAVLALLVLFARRRRK